MVHSIHMIWFSQEIIRLLANFPVTKRVAAEAVNAYAKQFAEETQVSDEGTKPPDTKKFDRTICNVIKCVVIKDNLHLSGQLEVTVTRRLRTDPGEVQIRLTRIQSHLRSVTQGCNLLH